MRSAMITDNGRVPSSSARMSVDVRASPRARASNEAETIACSISAPENASDRRAKPAVYFGGKSRIVDFALSNALNSGIRRLAVATQYKAHSLIRHLQRGWNFLQPVRNESFDILPASQRVGEDKWYAGTADAVFQNIDIIDGYGPEYLVILAGDHVYKMDYSALLAEHADHGADLTVACLQVPIEDASDFGVMMLPASAAAAAIA